MICKECKKEIERSEALSTEEGTIYCQKCFTALGNKPLVKKSVEMVNHPKHYGGDTTYECIKVLEAWLSPEEYKGFLKGNAIKYLCRTGKKDKVVQELQKAKWYIEKLIEKENKCE